MAVVALLGSLFISCKRGDVEARRNVENFYTRLSSDEYRRMAVRYSGIEDLKVEKSDSDIVMRINVRDDLHFRQAGGFYAETMRTQTLDNYRRIILTDSLVSKGLAGMRDLDMKLRTVFYDAYGDSASMVILPEEVVGKAQ